MARRDRLRTHRNPQTTEDTEATEKIFASCCYVATTRINIGDYAEKCRNRTPKRRRNIETSEAHVRFHPRGISPRGWAHCPGAADPSPAERDQDFACRLLLGFA